MKSKARFFFICISNINTRANDLKYQACYLREVALPLFKEALALDPPGEVKARNPGYFPIKYLTIEISPLAFSS
jgi:hypothetical protein